MRLVDDDALIKAIEDIKLYNVTPNQPAYDMNRVRADELIETINNQPTAYDVEKVVEELDAYLTKIVGRKSALYQTIIGIVRKGGVE